MNLESVSIVSNGSKLKRRWFEKYGKYLDILAISCDSFDEETNKKIGRGKGEHISDVRRMIRLIEDQLVNLTTLSQVHQARECCEEFNIKFKVKNNPWPRPSPPTLTFPKKS